LWKLNEHPIFWFFLQILLLINAIPVHLLKSIKKGLVTTINHWINPVTHFFWRSTVHWRSINSTNNSSLWFTNRCFKNLPILLPKKEFLDWNPKNIFQQLVMMDGWIERTKSIYTGDFIPNFRDFTSEPIYWDACIILGSS
jgi:hypothetical protein